MALRKRRRAKAQGEQEDIRDKDTKGQESKRPKREEPKGTILSLEQVDVIRDILEQKNVLVISKAGCGKTSTSLQAAFQYYQKYQERALLITYNARLKLETRARIKQMNMEHVIEAHSYHAAASKFFVPIQEGKSADNALIHEAINVPLPQQPIDFGLVILDEAQDMNTLYADFVKHILRLNTKKATMLIVGDPFQRIFGFNGSSCDFMTQPEQHFGSLCRNAVFHTHHLTICWRITHEMAKFINAHLNPCSLVHCAAPDWWEKNGKRIEAWWGTGIRANPGRTAAPDSIRIVHGWGSREIIHETKQLFQLFGNDEVALLAFSLKGERSPIRAIVDKLGKHSHENWVVLSGTTDSSDDILTGKRLASTIHRMKGLERRGIVVCGMDAFVEKIYGKEPLDHFNLFYVACTRAKDRLIINSTGTDYATIRCAPISSTKCKQSCKLDDLVKYVPFDDTLSVSEHLFSARIEMSSPEHALTLDRQSCIVQGRVTGTIEDLTQFMSQAILFRLMLILQKSLFKITFDTGNDSFDRDMMEFIHDFYRRVESDPTNINWPTLVKYSVAYQTFKTKFKHLWRQLTDYDVFTPSALLEKCTNNAMNILTKMAENVGKRVDEVVQFEIPIALPFYAPWFLEAFIGQVYGSIPILFNKDTVVGIECSNIVHVERGLEVSLESSVLSLLKQTHIKTVMILTNTAQLVRVDLKLNPSHEKVPLQYELLHRSIRRKMQLPPANGKELLYDFNANFNKKE